MSMLSAQVDELRSMAESVGLAVPQAATLMMEAADTILELRGSVHRERAEADRLREQGARLFDKTLELGTENARLRELVRHMNICLEHYEPDGSVGCEHCPLNNDVGNCDYEQRMRELGVTARWAFPAARPRA